MNIPQEAVEEAMLAMDGASSCGCSDCERLTVLDILTAAMPAIEKQVRAQVAAELRGELPVQLAETAQSPSGWLSDAQVWLPEPDAPYERIGLVCDGLGGVSSIDLHHIAEHAARIAEGSTHA